ncbi:hypothetical protein VPJG_00057 [Vibrio phage jenny 12G5]|nr:hypothetical protein VPJG_00057 [Vibrio phage jenny 12G5]
MQQVVTKKEAKEQGLKRYFTGKPCKHGHVAERFVSEGKCCACAVEKSRKYYEQNKDATLGMRRKYAEQNKEKIAEKNRKRYEQNKEKIAEQMREYREKNKDKLAEYSRKWRKKNKETLAEKKRKYREQNKEKVTESNRKWRKANQEHQFVRDSLKRIQGNWKGGRAKAEELLGYTCEQLRSHIESQFEDGMSWDDRSEWHVDHKKPIKAFLDEGITDPAIINALDNLQPLWAHENLSKGAKWDAKNQARIN